MKSFKIYLIEANVERAIFSQPPYSTPEQIYTQLVTRPNTPSFTNSDEFKQRNAEYRQLSASPMQKQGDNDDAWNYFHVNRGKYRETKTNSRPNKLGYTFKRYYSISGLENPDTIRRFAKAMPDLHSRLEGLGQHFKTAFSAKIPSNVHTLATHTDPLVIHHYDMPDSSLSRSIHATVKKWGEDHNLDFLDRQGTDIGVDHHQNGSFTEQLAKRIHSGETGSLSEIGKRIVDNAVNHIQSQK